MEIWRKFNKKGEVPPIPKLNPPLPAGPSADQMAQNPNVAPLPQDRPQISIAQPSDQLDAIEAALAKIQTGHNEPVPGEKTLYIPALPPDLRALLLRRKAELEELENNPTLTDEELERLMGLRDAYDRLGREIGLQPTIDSKSGPMFEDIHLRLQKLKEEVEKFYKEKQ